MARAKRSMPIAICSPKLSRKSNFADTVCRIWRLVRWHRRVARSRPSHCRAHGQCGDDRNLLGDRAAHRGIRTARRDTRRLWRTNPCQTFPRFDEAIWTWIWRRQSRTVSGVSPDLSHRHSRPAHWREIRITDSEIGYRRDAAVDFRITVSEIRARPNCHNLPTLMDALHSSDPSISSPCSCSEEKSSVLCSLLSALCSLISDL
jgi:hypothetical protein